MITFDLDKERYRLVITGLYVIRNSEADVKKLIAQWRADSGVDDPVKETFVQRVIRRWKKEPVKTRGEIHCLVEMDKDQMVYTAHFH